MRLQQFFLIVILFFLSACTDFTGMGIDNTPAPKPLAQFAPERQITPVWIEKLGKSSQDPHLKLRTAIAENKIIRVDGRNHVSAHQLETGVRLWKTAVGATIISGPSVAENVVVVGTEDGQVVALTLQNGRLAWKNNVADQVFAAPTIANGKVFVKTIDGRLMSLASRDGHLLWTYEHGAPLLVLRGDSAPQVADGLVLTGFADGKLAAFDAAQGKLLWERIVAIPNGAADIERMVDISADPVLTDGVAYVATYQGSLVSLLPRHGQRLWEHDISSNKELAVDPEFVFVVDTQSHLWAFYRKNGRVAWQQTQLEARDITAPTLMGNLLIVGDSQGYLHCLSREDGRFIARVFVNKSGITSRPVVVNNTVFVATRDGHLAAFKIPSNSAL